MVEQKVLQPDLGQLRGFSQETLELFHVRNNAAGWEWDTRTMSGGTATRWKSYASTRPDGDDKWMKYRWIPDRPTDAKYFYPPSKSLKAAIDENAGLLYMVGGEIALMSMIEAGLDNATCTFGDTNIPDTLAQDMRALGVKRLTLIPDRDDSGQRWACNIRDAIKNDLDASEIDVRVLALPYPMEKSHGKDVNDLWLEERDQGAFFDRVLDLPRWILPEPEVKIADIPLGDYDVDLPPEFVQAVERALEVKPQYNAEGWARKNVRCPFHDDKTPSATWNHPRAILRCHTCGESYLAKAVGEKFGIRLADFLDATPRIPKLVVTDKAPEIKLVEKTEKTMRPALPDGVALTDEQRKEAANGRGWLDDYLAYTAQSCPLAPDVFHEAMGLWLLATVSTRRLCLTIGGEHIYPNIYVLIVAKTSLYRKSTALKEAKKVLAKANLESLLIPADATPEALFDELAGVKPTNFDNLPERERSSWILGRAVAAQRAIMKDECSSIFAALKKEYMAGLSELLLEGYDGDSGKMQKLLKGRGLIIVRDMCLSFLGATTPVMYAKYITNEESENGFIARFAVVTPERAPEYRITDEAVDVPAALITRLRDIFLKVLPWHDDKPPSGKAFGEVITPPVESVMVAPDAMKQLMAYRKALSFDLIVQEKVEESKAAAYTRLGTMALKVAMLLALADTTARPVKIERRHAYAAQEIIERWRESLYRIDRDVARSTGSLEEKVLGYLKSTGGDGASMRDIMRDCAIRDRRMVEQSLTVLADDGAIVAEQHKPEGRGRPSIRYKANVDKESA